MIILALDTALDACAVAVADGARTLAHVREAMNRGQAERIAPMAQEAVEDAGIAFADIERIAVTTGPGSFTGVRIGLAFARGLALALKKPCVGIPTLEALALEAGEAGLRAGIVASPSAFYAALYADGAALIAPARMTVETAAEAFVAKAGERRSVMRGRGAAEFAARLKHAEAVEALAPDVRALAMRAATLDPARYPAQPLYLRAALE